MIRLLRFHPAWGMRWLLALIAVSTIAWAAYDVLGRAATVWQPSVVAIALIAYAGFAAPYARHHALTSARTGTFWSALPLSPAALRRFQLLGFVLIAFAGALALPAAMAAAALLGADVPIAAVWRWLVLFEVGLLWVVVSHNSDEPDAVGSAMLAIMAIVGGFVAYQTATPATAALLATAIAIATIHWSRGVNSSRAGAPWRPLPQSQPEWAPDDGGWAEPVDDRGVFTMAPNALARADDPSNGRWLLHRVCMREVSRPQLAAVTWPLLLCVGTVWVIAQFGPGHFLASLSLLFFLFTPIRWSLGHTSRLAALPISPRRLFAFAVLPHLCWIVMGTLPMLLLSVRADGIDVIFSRTAMRSVWILVVMFFGLLVQATGRGALAPPAGTWRSFGKWLIASPFPWLAVWSAIVLFAPRIPQPNGTSVSLDAVLINGLADVLPANRLTAFAVVLATAAAGYYVAERRFARNVEAVTYAFDAAASRDGGLVP